MYKVEPSGETLGCSIRGMDLSKPFGKPELGFVLQALADYGVVCFPKQSLDPAAQVAFSREFGELEVHVSGVFQEPGHPEVMILSNIVENGKPVGLADAGQDWHTDMSFSKTIAFINVLYALKVPRRDGRPLGATLFANMMAAYDALGPKLTRLTPSFSSLPTDGSPLRIMTFTGQATASTNSAMAVPSVRPMG